MSNIITLPVSLGEALDKHTILYIKLDKITDDRRVAVKTENDAIDVYLNKYVEKYKYFYDILKRTNLLIWELQDEIRGMERNETYVNKCLTILDENDKRFRVKNKINNLCNSELKEQKGYGKKNAFIVTHLGMGDMLVMVGAVRYLSFIYDNVVVVCKKAYYNNVAMLYKDDPSIKLICIDGDNEPLFIMEQSNKYNAMGYDIYACGAGASMIYGSSFNLGDNIHLSFYNNLKMDVSIMKDYFYISDIDGAIELYDMIPKGMNYVFLHTCASNMEISINIDSFKNSNILIINPNKNMYEPSDECYELSKKFIDKPLLMYKKIIENASEIHMVDSSFSCLTALLLNKSNIKKCLYPRDSNSYPSLFDATWEYKYRL